MLPGDALPRWRARAPNGRRDGDGPHATRWLRTCCSAGLDPAPDCRFDARIRGLLEIPGGPSEEARALLDLLDATALPDAPGLAGGFGRYVALLEASGRPEEALAAIATLLRRLESFDSPSEGCDLALAVGRLNGNLARWDRAAAALDLADSAARASGDAGRIRLACLGRAALWAAQGRLADARSAVEAMLAEAGDDLVDDSTAEGWASLGHRAGTSGAAAGGTPGALPGLRARGWRGEPAPRAGPARLAPGCIGGRGRRPPGVHAPSGRAGVVPRRGGHPARTARAGFRA